MTRSKAKKDAAKATREARLAHEAEAVAARQRAATAVAARARMRALNMNPGESMLAQDRELRRMTKVQQKAVTEDRRPHPGASDRVRKSMALQADPFESELCSPVVNNNLVPSLFQSNIRLTSTGQVNVSANSTIHMGLMPGHNGEAPEAPMDASANHCRLVQGSGPDPFVWGPLGVQNTPFIVPLAGFISNNLAAGTSLNDLSGLDLSTRGLPWDNAAPYIANTSSPSADNTDHSRWQVTGIAIRVMNTTQTDTRGGDVVTVAPVKPFSSAVERDFTRFPSRRATTDANFGTHEVSVALRQTDMAMWHPYNGGSFSNQIKACALHIFFRNPTASAQTYTYQIAFTWALAGTSLMMVSTPTITYPTDADLVKPAQELMQESAHSAHDGPTVVDVVAAGLSGAKRMASKTPSFVTSAGHFIHEVYGRLGGLKGLPAIGAQILKNISI